MITECPKCGKKPKISAVHGKIRTFTCLSCGQGWKTGINGTTSYKEVLVEFGSVLDKMIVTIGKRKVRLAPIKAEVTAYESFLASRRIS